MRSRTWFMLVAATAGCGPAAAPPPEPPAEPTSTLAVDEPEPAPVEGEYVERAEEPAEPEPTGEFDVPDPTTLKRTRQSRTPPVRTVDVGVSLKKRWSTTVGRTTFRTTMVLENGQLIIGTHGQSLKGANERGDAIYVVDAKTGKVARTHSVTGAGDRDVGGVALVGDTLFYGTDQGSVVARSLASGKTLWSVRAKGKVRAAPALADLNGDGTDDVVVGDESGVLRAFDGKNGKKLWAAATGKNDYGAHGFIGAAAVAKLNDDATPDVVAGARDGVLNAYDGTNGEILWQVADSSGIHASPSIADFDGDGKPEVLASWSYGDVRVIDGRTGTVRWHAELAQDDGGIEGLFGSPIPISGRPGALVQPVAWWGKDDGIVGVGPLLRVFKSFEGRVSATAVVTDLGDDGTLEAILGTEAGQLVALRADGGRAVLAKLGGPVEAPALLGDGDGDGTIELFVASNDGKLTCFETGSTSKPRVARFRGNDPRNTGQLGTIKLGWSVAGERARPNEQPGIRVDYLRCCAALSDSAARAPADQQRSYLEAASRCNELAANRRDRREALRELARALKGAALPPACR